MDASAAEAVDHSDTQLPLAATEELLASAFARAQLAVEAGQALDAQHAQWRADFAQRISECLNQRRELLREHEECRARFMELRGVVPSIHEADDVVQ